MANKPQPTQKVLTKKHLARLERERIQQRYLVIGTIVVAVIVLAILAYGILDQSVFKSLKPVAKVGNTNITTGDYQKQVRFQRYQMIDQLKNMASDQMYLQYFGSYISQIYSQLTDTATFGQKTLDSMEEDILVQQKAKELGISVSDADVDKGMEEAFGYFANGTPTPTITPTTIATETLSAQLMTLLPPTSTPNPTTTAIAATATQAAFEKEATATQAVLEATASPTSGPTSTSVPPTATEAATPTLAGSPTATVVPTITLTPTPFTKQAYEKRYGDFLTSVKGSGYTKDDLRALIKRGLLREKVVEALGKDVPTTAEQVWARHILVATEDEAKKAIERLNNGEKFDDVAKEMSIDTGSKEQGGDLGWFTKDKMVAAFSDAAFALKVGEISQPVKSDNGYHVIQVLGHEQNRPLTADEISQAKQTKYTDWLTQAKKDANIQTYDVASVTPADPAVPADLENLIKQYAQPQQ